MNDERSVLIGEEIAAHRDTAIRIRSILHGALRKGTKHELQNGCLMALSALDTAHPVGKGFHGGNETPAVLSVAPPPYEEND